MRKLIATLVIATLLAACNVTVVTGPQPDTPVTVGDDTGASVTLAAGQTHCFELTVAAAPVRIDVYHAQATADGELYVKVLDENDEPYAHTNVRSFFQDADVALTPAGALAAQDVNISFPYSVNLPKNMGKVYVEVTNKTSTEATVTVKAFERNEVVRDQTPMAPPASGQLSTVYGGAILFLGQHDTYEYTGESGSTITFDVTDPTNPLELKAVLNKGLPSETELEIGIAVNLLPDDVVEVFATGDARAGFCANQNLDDGCFDGLDSGEYSLTIQ